MYIPLSQNGLQKYLSSEIRMENKYLWSQIHRYLHYLQTSRDFFYKTQIH